MEIRILYHSQVQELERVNPTCGNWYLVWTASLLLLLLLPTLLHFLLNVCLIPIQHITLDLNYIKTKYDLCLVHFET